MKKAFLITLLAAGMTVTMTSGTVAQEREGGMGSGMMQGGMGSGMMGGGMPGMMGSGMMRDGTGMLFGSRVVPTMNLSVDDVRDYLNSRLDRLHNKRLKLGDVKTDDATISADVVTGDNSLVQRLKINRRTGEI